MSLTTQHQSVNGFDIAYISRDSSYDRNVLFIHGNLASKEWWIPSMEYFGRRGGNSHLVAADWRGYGDSKGITSAEQIDFKLFAKDMIALLEQKDMTDVTLVGHSTGGFIALLAALEKPELFNKIVLLDSVGPEGLHIPEPTAPVYEHFVKMSEDFEYCKVVLAATINGCDPNSPQFLPLLEKTFASDKAMFKGVIENLNGPHDYKEALKALNISTLVIHGDKDLVLTMDVAETLDSLLPNSKLHVAEGYGHSMNMENPEAFAQLCESFWD